jgi:hypothetical protein
MHVTKNKSVHIAKENDRNLLCGLVRITTIQLCGQMQSRLTVDQVVKYSFKMFFQDVTPPYWFRACLILKGHNVKIRPWKVRPLR